MNRRKFIILILIGGTAAVWSSRPLAQQPAMPTIGYLSSEHRLQEIGIVKAFLSGLTVLGYTEGKNIRVLYRYADLNADRLSGLAIELVSFGATVIVTGGSTAIVAAHDAAPNVPIVVLAGADPVTMGWAQTLARPGGMITGVFLSGSSSKRLELLKEVRPKATTFGFLMDPTNPVNPVVRKDVDNAARKLGINLEIIEVKDQSALADTLERMGARGVAGVALSPDPLFSSNAQTIIDLARIHKLPVLGATLDFVPAGGLFTLSWDYLATAKRAAWYVDQILKGTAPGDLPAELTTEYRLLVNLKTAKELGITIPASVLVRAYEVIE
jgi:putative tryptophan/tyrosine transport system substrate-binding protein